MPAVLMPGIGHDDIPETPTMPHSRIFSTTALRTLRWPLVGMMCLALVGGGYLTRGSTASADEALFDTTRLPRIPGAKELYAMPATTSFTTPGPVAQSADATRKLLAADGWQEYSPLSGAGPGNSEYSDFFDSLLGAQAR